MNATTGPLPRWDMSRLYPSLESAEFQAAFARAIAGIGALHAAYDRAGIRAGADGKVDDATTAAFEALIRQHNALLDEIRTLSAYISAFVSTNSRDDVAQARESELQQHLVELRKLGTRFQAWVGSLDVDALLDRSPLAREHAFPLRKAARAARHQMSEAEEDLAASLSPSAGTAWARLHGNVASRLVVHVAGQPTPLPMSAVRALAHDPRPDVRKAAYEAEPQTTPPAAPSTTGRTPSASSSAWGCTRGTARIPKPSERATTTCSRPPACRAPPTWPPGSASTSAPAASGTRAWT